MSINPFISAVKPASGQSREKKNIWLRQNNETHNKKDGNGPSLAQPLRSAATYGPMDECHYTGCVK